MGKLLSANFARLGKSKLFWLGLACMAAFAAWAVGVRAYEARAIVQYANDTADELWFVGGIYLPLVLSVFVSLWIGADYDHGTVRNKLLVGHTRSELYFANLIICTAVAVLYHLVYIAVVWGMGCALLSPFVTQARDLFLLTAISVGAVVAMSSVFTLMAMLIPNRAAGGVAAILLALGMMMAAMSVYTILTAPEFIDNALTMSANGEVIPADPVPNPKFPTGQERIVYTHILNLIPAGQIFVLSGMTYRSFMALLPLYAFVLVVITTGLGLFLLRRKDIR